MFPGISTDVLTTVLQQNRMNVGACVEPLLAMADPSYRPPSGAPWRSARPPPPPRPPPAVSLGSRSVASSQPACGDVARIAPPTQPANPAEAQQARQATEMQIAQDEMFARMLADQLFHEELARSGALGTSIPIARPVGVPGVPIVYAGVPVGPSATMASPSAGSTGSGAAAAAAGGAPAPKASGATDAKGTLDDEPTPHENSNIVESLKNLSDGPLSACTSRPREQGTRPSSLTHGPTGWCRGARGTRVRAVASGKAQAHADVPQVLDHAQQEPG